MRRLDVQDGRRQRNQQQRDVIVSQEEGMRGHIYLHSGKAGGKEAGSS